MNRVVIVSLVAVAVGLLGFLLVQIGQSTNGYEDQVPESVIGASSGHFQLVLGQPGSMATVTTDIGRLSVSPQAVVEEKAIGTVKKESDSVVALGNDKKRQYEVDPEGLLCFSFSGDTDHLGEVATIRVVRGEDYARSFQVKILAEDAALAAVSSVARIELKQVDAWEDDNLPGLWLTVRFVDQNGASVNLSDFEYFLRCKVLNADSSSAYLLAGDGSQVTENAYLIMEAEPTVPVGNIPVAPITLTLTLENADGTESYASRSLSVYRGMVSP